MMITSLKIWTYKSEARATGSHLFSNNLLSGNLSFFGKKLGFPEFAWKNWDFLNVLKKTEFSCVWLWKMDFLVYSFKKTGFPLLFWIYMEAYFLFHHEGLNITFYSFFITDFSTRLSAIIWYHHHLSCIPLNTTNCHSFKR